MSLILGVSKGEKLYVGEVVLEILNTTEDKKHIHINVAGVNFLLNDREFVEICPSVFAAVGRAKHENTVEGVKTLPRLAIDAPREIRILRENNRGYGRNH